MPAPVAPFTSHTSSPSTSSSSTRRAPPPPALVLDFSTASSPPSAPAAGRHVRRRSSGRHSVSFLASSSPSTTVDMSLTGDDDGERRWEEKDESSRPLLLYKSSSSSPKTGSTTTPQTPSTPAPPYSPPHTPPSLFSSPSSSRRSSSWLPFSGTAPSARTERVRVVWLLLGVLMGVVGGYQAAMRGVGGREGTGETVVMAALSTERGAETIPGRCDPYAASRPGHLLLHPTNYTLNNWQTLPDGSASSSSCEAVNWMDRLRRTAMEDNDGMSEEEVASLEFLREKSVVSFGDSVDRDQTEHFCAFAGGRFNMIHAGSPASPKYPIGEERPNGGHYKYAGYNLDLPGNLWHDYGPSRPHMCHVERLNLTVFNVFHYGFTEEEDWLRRSPHFYPPSALDARFTQIVLPLLRTFLGASTRGPTIFQFSPGYWDLMRQIKHDELLTGWYASQGQLDPERQYNLGAWSELSAERRGWFEAKFEGFLERVLKEFGEEGGTRVVWRTLHQPRPFNNAPPNRVAVVDSIARSVVARQLAKGPNVRERLYLNNWGKMITGYEHLFRDDIHPAPLPASWLQWNILLEQVAVQAELEKQKAER